ncbi:MAG: TonB-dependent receptor [Gammaproteobacteria bacterium]
MKNRKKKHPSAAAIGMILTPLHAHSAEPADTIVLPDIEVTAPPENAYKSDAATVGSKIEMPIRDIPQSVSVVKKELIESQNAFSLRDALKNVSGLTIAAGEGGRTGDSITLRGFAAHSDTYLDGVKDNGQYFRDTFFLERIEVLKGSSSILFGRGSTGGVINEVSKKPLPETLAIGDFTYGSFDFKRATLDVGAAPLDTVALRLNGLWQDADSFRDFNFTDRWGVAPAVKLNVGPNTDLTFNFLHQEEDSVFDYGVPMFRGEPAEVPIERFYGFPEDRLQEFDVNIVTAAFSHRFTSDFSVKNSFRFGDYERFYRIHLFNNVTDLGATSTVDRRQALRLSTQDNYYNQTDFVLTKPVLGFPNTLMFGVEVGWEDFTFRSKDSNDEAPISIFAPTVTPTVGAGRANDFSGILATDRITDTETVAGYVLDQFEITPEWKLLGGARYDVFEAKQDDRIATGDFSRTDKEWNPRAGIVWQPTDWQSYYFSYGSSFNPSAEALSLNVSSANLPPEDNRNFEVGAKLDLLNGRLAANAALFRLEKTNARTTDPNDPTFNVLAGEQRTDGLELELAGEILPHWGISVAYALLDAEVVKSNTTATGSVSGLSKSLQGKEPINVPDHSGVVWTSYRLSDNWEVGGGVFFATERFTDSVNEVTLPGYARLDAVLAYHQKHFDVQLNVFNLADTEYFESGQTLSALPGVPISAQATVRIRY